MLRSLLALLVLGAAGCKAVDGPDGGASDAGEDDGGNLARVCAPGTSSGPVAAPQHRLNIPGPTGWFNPPTVVDLDGDGSNEIVAGGYALLVYSDEGEELARVATAGPRIFAPAVITDLDRDGTQDIVIGQGKYVYAYQWEGGSLQRRDGFPFDTTTAGRSPEVRGLAAADLGGTGRVQIIATTSQTASTDSGGAQVFVLEPDGTPYHPSTRSTPDWPRYNALSGTGNDADRNGAGHDGYGCYGLNPGVGQLDDDAPLELVVTFDNHFIQAFDADGVALDTAPYFTNPKGAYLGNRLSWGQMIRWVDPAVEKTHFHDHSGEFASPETEEWLQWTQSPPSIVDLDGDGKAEVVAVANVEKGSPYQTVAWAVTVLEGAHGDGSRSGMRKRGWEVFPRGGTPMRPSGYYPPIASPAAAIADIRGDAKREILVSLNDGYLSAYDAGGGRLWRVELRHGRSIMFTAEPTVADLNQDGTPEIVIATYGAPDAPGSGMLMVLSSEGAVLHDLPLPDQGTNGNGIGSPAAPTLADLDGDGTLEILVQTFDHGIDVFTVPGSAANCLPWPTARGGLLRQGRPH